MFNQLLKIIVGLNRLNTRSLPWAENLHKRWVLWLFRGSAIGLTIGLILNLMGWGQVNYLFTLVAIGIAIFYATHPRALLYLTEAGATYGAVAPGISMSEAAEKLLRAYARAILDILTILSIIFLVLGTIPFRENWFAAITGLSITATGYLVQRARGKNGTFALRVAWGIVIVAGIGTVYSLIPDETIVRVTGIDIKGILSPNPATEAAYDVLHANKTALQQQKKGEIDALMSQAKTGSLTSEEQKKLNRLLKENSLPQKALSALIDSRKPFTVTWTVKLGRDSINLPADVEGCYRVEYPEQRIAYRYPMDAGWAYLSSYGAGRGQNGEILIGEMRSPSGGTVCLEESQREIPVRWNVRDTSNGYPRVVQEDQRVVMTFTPQ